MQPANMVEHSIKADIANDFIARPPLIEVRKDFPLLIVCINPAICASKLMPWVNAVRIQLLLEYRQLLLRLQGVPQSYLDCHAAPHLHQCD